MFLSVRNFQSNAEIWKSLLKRITLAARCTCGMLAIEYAYTDGALVIRTHASKVGTFVGGTKKSQRGSLIVLMNQVSRRGAEDLGSASRREEDRSLTAAARPG